MGKQTNHKEPVTNSGKQFKIIFGGHTHVRKEPSKESESLRMLNEGDVITGELHGEHWIALTDGGYVLNEPYIVTLM